MSINTPYKVPQTKNLLLGIALFAFQAFALFLLPIFLLPISPYYLLLLLPITLLTNTYWALIHEAIHSNFHTNRALNERAARGMAISFGTVFHLVRFGHLLHHQYNRTGIDLTEGYDPKNEKHWAAQCRYYFQVFWGLYATEIIGPIFLFLPRQLIVAIAEKLLAADSPHLSVGKKVLLKPSNLWKMRLDAIIMYVSLCVAFKLYGAWWPALLAMIVIRGHLISFADNLPHYGTPIDDVRYSYNMNMPRLFQKLILNFNMHRIHHEYPNIPWTGLPQQFTAQKDVFDVNYFVQGWRQWRGVIPIEQLNAKTLKPAQKGALAS